VDQPRRLIDREKRGQQHPWCRRAAGHLARNHMKLFTTASFLSKLGIAFELRAFAERMATVRQFLANISAMAFGKLEGADVRRRRAIGVVQGLFTGIANRMVGVAVSLLSVPLTISYLGSERYGVWTLIGSILAWLALADLGIGNALTNAVAGALGSGRPDLLRSHISTAFAILTSSSLIIGVAVAVAWPFIDWAVIFNVATPAAKSEVGPAMAAAVFIFLLSFPLSVIQRTYNGLQEGKLSNYWSAAGNVLSLCALLLVTKIKAGLFLLVVAVSGTNLLVQVFSGVWLFTRHKREFAPNIRSVRRASVREVAPLGIQFFLIQIMALSIFQTDNLMIAHFLGASSTPTYSITYKLFDYLTLGQNLLMGYLWVAYADAIARKDIGWVKRTFKRTIAFSVSLTCAGLIPLVLFARPFIRLWTRGEIDPPLDLVFWMAAWSLIYSICSPIACLLAAASQIKAQLVYAAILSVANFAASVTLIPRWGVTGAIAGTVISFLLFNCGPTIVDVSLLLKRLSRSATRSA
jgi:O-antigen/teichoic acid export membrane protein